MTKEQITGILDCVLSAHYNLGGASEKAELFGTKDLQVTLEVQSRVMLDLYHELGSTLIPGGEK